MSYKANGTMSILTIFFTSYSLLSDLEKSEIYGCGTARKDRRGFPGNLKKAKFKNR